MLAATTSVTDTVISGPFLLAAVLAIGAGVVSFASPCIVPLVPGYLSYLAGLVGAETRVGSGRLAPVRAGAGFGIPAGAGGFGPTAPATIQPAPAPGPAATATTTATTTAAAPPAISSRPAPRGRVPWRVVAAAALFVLGFSVVFLAESALVLGLSSTLLANKNLLIRIGGAVTILMGLLMAGAIPFLQREFRPRLGSASYGPRRRVTGRVGGAVLLGAAFGTGWLACSSPALAGVLALANATEWGSNAWRGLALVVAYCLGVGIPFLVLAFGFGWAASALRFLRRHARTIQLVGAAALVVVGVLMVTGVWTTIVAQLQTTAVSVL